MERHVSGRRFSFLNADSELALNFSSARFDEPPFNNSFLVLRSKFDRWFAEQARGRRGGKSTPRWWWMISCAMRTAR